MAVIVRFYPLRAVANDVLRFAVIVARMNGQWVFCRHRERATLECPGGHREPDEDALDAARRELYEETGATDFSLEPVCVYSVERDGGGESFGLLCRAEIKALGPLPEGFEMAELQLLDILPPRECWTYPDIQPRLLARAGVCALSVREHPAYATQALAYIQNKWANEKSMPLYEDCMQSALKTTSSLPQWYALMDGARIIGCAGLITNDFISRMDLWPWLCGLYVEKDCRGHGYGALLMERARRDAHKAGFSRLYLCTGHVGYYERYGFAYLATGFHPWGEKSRIYEGKTE